jgi:hypothetical protein
VSVKISLFDDQRGGVWKFLAERILFLAFYPSAAATRYIGLFTFFAVEKSKSPSDLEDNILDSG